MSMVVVRRIDGSARCNSGYPPGVQGHTRCYSAAEYTVSLAERVAVHVCPSHVLPVIVDHLAPSR